jgi:hypothetical protein
LAHVLFGKPVSTFPGHARVGISGWDFGRVLLGLRAFDSHFVGSNPSTPC